MGHHQHRSVPCPAQAVAGQFAAIGAIGAVIAVNTHRDGMAAMRQARDDQAAQLWSQRLASSRVTAANAVVIARQAVTRVQALEAEIESLRRAVNSRDTLIRRLAANG